jgi:sacsin
LVIPFQLRKIADDAGAGVVRFMLDETSYGTTKLMGPKMAAWQGPALVVYNDAVFSASDVQAIARIGQDSKARRLDATGRFGLGFNAVYHVTELPSFVSGDVMVSFDPAAAFLPGVSPAHPGLKIKVTGSPLLDSFPDSFEPFKHFGSDMRQRFEGTIFRFPLRTAELARLSDIKRQECSPEHILELFDGFAEGAASALLFLKSVRQVELCRKRAGSSEVETLLDVRLQAAGAEHPQTPIHAFVKGPEFYQRLAQMEASELPGACGRVKLAISRPGAANGAEEGGKGAESVQSWLVCNVLGGGQAREMCLESFGSGAHSGRSRGWVPWGGVAARIDPAAATTVRGCQRHSFFFSFSSLFSLIHRKENSLSSFLSSAR